MQSHNQIELAMFANEASGKMIRSSAKLKGWLILTGKIPLQPPNSHDLIDAVKSIVAPKSPASVGVPVSATQPTDLPPSLVGY